MWDSNSPLQLLQAMPRKLTKENLEKLQMVIDADKYKNSLVSGFDLCGMYAPFCRGCKKTSIYPCAIAYVNMLRAEGSDIEIDARPLNSAAVPAVAPADNIPEKQASEEIAVAVAAETTVTEEEPHEEKIPVAEAAPDTVKEEPEPVIIEGNKKEEVLAELPSPPKALKRKIRIAVARKKL